MRKRLFITFLVLGVLVGGGAAAWRVLRLSELAHIGAGYSAQQTCSCLFVSRRPAESCRMDLDPLARLVVSVKPGASEVSARSMFLERATSRYQEGLGCSLQN